MRLHSPPSSSVHGDSPGKNTGMGWHALLPGIFPTQGSNPYLLMSPGLTCRFFTTSATWEAKSIPAAAAAKLLQCDPRDGSPPGSPVPGILQARTLEWVSFPSPTHEVKSESGVAQSCPTPCDPRDGSPPGSPVPGILQARTLEWLAISFSIRLSCCCCC